MEQVTDETYCGTEALVLEHMVVFILLQLKSIGLIRLGFSHQINGSLSLRGFWEL